MNDVRTDAELVALAAAGDRQAFAKLCNRHKTRLWRITAGVARGPDAEDLAQEAIVRAWCSIESCRNATSFAAWLCRIAVNAAHDYHRSPWRRRIEFVGSSANIDDSPYEDLAQAAERRETARRVRRAVAALPPRQCVPIWMHYFEQFTVTEIAALESTAESTIRSRMSVGMKRLRHTLGDLISESEAVQDTMLLPKGLHI